MNVDALDVDDDVAKNWVRVRRFVRRRVGRRQNFRRQNVGDVISRRVALRRVHVHVEVDGQTFFSQPIEKFCYSNFCRQVQGQGENWLKW